jgi:molybdopterin-guanine dinucleotide biosynthesis protein A
LHPEPISGLILAGGAGSRMGGVDKGLQPYRGKPLVQWAIACLAPQVDELIISANRNLDRYAEYGYQVVADTSQDDYAGPLAGLQAGLSAAHHDLLLCVPCDTPHLPNDLASRLLAGLAEAPIAVARCADHPQPTVCLVRRTLLPTLTEFLASGERKMGWWQRQRGAVYVDFDDAAAFANFNTSADIHPPGSIVDSTAHN